MNATTAKLRFVYFVPALLLTLLIYVLLTMPGKDIPSNPFFEMVHFDKWVHAGLFGGFVFLYSLPFLPKFSYRNRFFWIIILLAIIYGVAMEFVQKYLTPDRDYDTADMIADSVGALIGYFAFRFVAAKIAKKNKPL